jgi:alpha-ribazole phosphatase
VPFDNVLCSELERARHTTQLILAIATSVRNMPALNEMFLATGRCATIATWREKMPKTMPRGVRDWQNATPTNGEGFQAFSRAWNALFSTR